ncbi:MAG: cob(I)yrinic acid a,c-diamide adenosyltransferase [Ignisphaera sp.]
MRAVKKVHRGDDGYTDIFGLRLPKDSPIIELIGELDELVSLIGVVKSILKENSAFLDIVNNLTAIQRKLMYIASYVASKGDSRVGPPITYDDVAALEKAIDILWSAQTMSRFTIPGSSKESALLHLLRAVCRRVERRAVTLLRNGAIDPLIHVFLNRLSDWLYVSALYINKVMNIEEDYLH